MTVDKKPLSNELIDALLGEYKKPEDLIGENGQSSVAINERPGGARERFQSQHRNIPVADPWRQSWRAAIGWG